MVTESGVIQRVVDRKAIVRIQRSSACSQCDARGACRVISDKEMDIEVLNELRARVGDQVEISVPGGSLVKMSMLVYFVPVVALMIGAYGANLWAQSHGYEPTLASIIGGVGAMAVTFLLLKRIDRSMDTRYTGQPRMTRILMNQERSPCGDNK